MIGGVGFAIGLTTTSPQWFYDVSYNPMVSAVIAIGVSVSIWVIDRSSKK